MRWLRIWAVWGGAWLCASALGCGGTTTRIASEDAGSIQTRVTEAGAPDVGDSGTDSADNVDAAAEAATGQVIACQDSGPMCLPGNTAGDCPAVWVNGPIQLPGSGAGGTCPIAPPPPGACAAFPSANVGAKPADPYGPPVAPNYPAEASRFGGVLDCQTGPTQANLFGTKYSPRCSWMLMPQPNAAPLTYAADMCERQCAGTVSCYQAAGYEQCIELWSTTNAISAAYCAALYDITP